MLNIQPKRRPNARRVRRRMEPQPQRSPRQSRQLDLAFPSSWGGARPNAGRKRGPRANTPHRARPIHRASEPVHVTLRARIAPLRSQFVFPTVRLALLRAARHEPERFRIVHFSVQRDHVHLVVEARDAQCLSSGVRGLAVRIARYVNDLLGRRGSLWAARWHGRALRSPREVRSVILYVLANFRKHAPRALRAGIDPFSSALWFNGWREWTRAAGMPPPYAESAPWLRRCEAEEESRSSLRPRTWLAAMGWRRHALLSMTERPAG